MKPRKGKGIGIMNAARSLQVALLSVCIVLLSVKAVDAFSTAQQARKEASERAQWRTKTDDQRRAKVCERLPFTDGCNQVF